MNEKSLTEKRDKETYANEAIDEETIEETIAKDLRAVSPHKSVSAPISYIV